MDVEILLVQFDAALNRFVPFNYLLQQELFVLALARQVVVYLFGLDIQGLVQLGRGFRPVEETLSSLGGDRTIVGLQGSLQFQPGLLELIE